MSTLLTVKGGRTLGATKCVKIVATSLSRGIEGVHHFPVKWEKDLKRTVERKD